MTNRQQPLLRVYGDMYSGNCYKIKLLLNHLDMPHEWLHVDIMKGESRTPAFLARNPNGRIPLLELPDGRRLAESNAILNFLASGTALLPDDPWMRALVLPDVFLDHDSPNAMYGRAGLDAKGIVAKVFETLGKDFKAETVKLA